PSPRPLAILVVLVVVHRSCCSTPLQVRAACLGQRCPPAMPSSDALQRCPCEGRQKRSRQGLSREAAQELIYATAARMVQTKLCCRLLDSQGHRWIDMYRLTDLME